MLTLDSQIVCFQTDGDHLHRVEGDALCSRTRISLSVQGRHGEGINEGAWITEPDPEL